MSPAKPLETHPIEQAPGEPRKMPGLAADNLAMLNRLREKKRESFQTKKAERISSVREEVRAKMNEQEEKKNQEEEMLQNPEKAYEKVFRDFKWNTESYRKPDGWRDQYLTALDENGKPVRSSMSIEEFVLKNQEKELENIRNELMLKRITKYVDQIYTDLTKEEDPEKREAGKAKKAEEINVKSAAFFDNPDNRIKIEDYFNAEGSEQAKLKDGLLKGFKEGVFSDLGDKVAIEPLKTSIESLFADLMGDYKQMLVAKKTVKDLNTDMVAWMGDETMTEEKWNEELAKLAEAKAKELEEQQKKQEEATKTVASTAPSTFNGSDYGYVDISAGSKLSENTEIAINQIRPGVYQIKFPSKSGEGQVSEFQVRQLMENGKPLLDEQGKPKNVYIFNDSVINGSAVVGENEFKKEVNILYLGHEMESSNSPERGYVSPELNSIISNRAMYEMASKLFVPTDIAKVPMNPTQAIVFRNLMMIISGKNNNEGTPKGDYGDLLAIQNRVRFVNFMLGLDSGSKAAACYKFLETQNSDSLKNMTVENLAKRLNVPVNHGNYS